MPSAPSHWLMKTEPDVFGIDHLAERKVERWDGVRNLWARNHIRSMKVGDRVLFYHSSVAPPGVAGLARICRAAYPDFTAWDPASDYYDEDLVKMVEDFQRQYRLNVDGIAGVQTQIVLDALNGTPGTPVLVAQARGTS